MINLTVGVFGDAEFAKKLGKKGTANDITIYNHASSEGAFTYVTVSSEKIQPLLQAVNMSDVPVVAISELTPLVGEQLVAISEFGFEKGFLHLDNVTEDQIKPLIRGTCIENFRVVKDHTELVEELKKLDISREGDLLVQIDNYFDVKSIGTVVLGIVRSGTIRKYDKVIVEPLGKEVLIKGIQSQDKDIESAEPGRRVGLNIKGVSTDELKRGYVIGKIDKMKLLKLRFTKSKFSRETLKENDQVFVSSGLQVVPGTVRSAGEFLEIETESHVTHRNGKFLIASTKQSMPRIIGFASPA